MGAGFIVLIVVVIFIAMTTFFKMNGKKVIEKIDIENYSGKIEKAVFAGGCFWCMEAAFEEIDGVIEVISGYTGGDKVNPSYGEVSSGKTLHKEAVQVLYDPEKVSYEELLNVFWRQIDPTDDGGQFVDRGPQYRTAIFYKTDDQKNLAEESKQALDRSKKFDKPIVTEILSEKEFYKAEEYHQDYSQKRSIQYKIYEKASGRKDFVEKTWEDENR